MLGGAVKVSSRDKVIEVIKSLDNADFEKVAAYVESLSEKKIEYVEKSELDTALSHINSKYAGAFKRLAE